MPRIKSPQIDLLADLKDMSDEADHLALNELFFPASLDDFFAAIKINITAIRDCKDVKDIQYINLKSFLGDDDKKSKNADSSVSEAQKEKVHNKDHTSGPHETEEKNNSKQKENYKLEPVFIKDFKCTKNASDCDKNSNKKMVTPAPSSCKKVTSAALTLSIHTPKVNSTYNKSIPESNNLDPQYLMQTPVLNRTFNKIEKSLIFDSGSSISNKGTKKILSIYSDIEVKSSSSKKLLKNKGISGKNMLTRSGSKKSLKNSSACRTAVLTRSGSKKLLENDISNGKTISSGSKRKSSPTNGSNKKQKIEMQDISAKSSNKSYIRHPLADKNGMRTNHLTSENKSKVPSVIVPPVLPKQSVISKEQLILEEIKKKEEKANQNIKRMMAERQQKAEQNKKNREEKQSRTLQKRIQMEKEKEERLEKVEAKLSQAKVPKETAKNPVKKIRSKELSEKHTESKTSVLTAAKQNEAATDSLTKTPVNKKSSDEIESYELTPLPDSSTYNFSEDEDEKPSGKPIPLWAQGVHLKSALIQQYYNPVNTDVLFGKEIKAPDLVDIFSVSKKRYLKRTSSAVWNTTPDRSFYYN